MQKNTPELLARLSAGSLRRKDERRQCKNSLRSNSLPCFSASILSSPAASQREGGQKALLAASTGRSRKSAGELSSGLKAATCSKNKWPQRDGPRSSVAAQQYKIYSLQYWWDQHCHSSRACPLPGDFRLFSAYSFKPVKE